MISEFERFREETKALRDARDAFQKMCPSDATGTQDPFERNLAGRQRLDLWNGVKRTLFTEVILPGHLQDFNAVEFVSQTVKSMTDPEEQPA